MTFPLGTKRRPPNGPPVIVQRLGVKPSLPAAPR